jgi:hypothetical protein
MDVTERIEETVLAPVGSALVSRDTEIVERDGWYQVITPSTKTTQGNEVVLSRIAAADVDAAIHRTVDQYAAHHVPFKWCVGPLTEPADFAGALERHGFVGWPVRGMAIEPLSFSRTPHEGVSVEPVTNDNLAEYYACWVRGWDISVPDAGAWIDDHRRALATGRFHFYLARIGGEPVGTAGLIVKRRCVYLVGGNVIAAHQHKGVYRALLDERLTLAASLGSPLAVTQAREATSAPILEKLGFESLYTSHVYRWEP